MDIRRIGRDRYGAATANRNPQVKVVKNKNRAAFPNKPNSTSCTTAHQYLLGHPI